MGSLKSFSFKAVNEFHMSYFSDVITFLESTQTGLPLSLPTITAFSLLKASFSVLCTKVSKGMLKYSWPKKTLKTFDVWSDFVTWVRQKVFQHSLIIINSTKDTHV